MPLNIPGIFPASCQPNINWIHNLYQANLLGVLMHGQNQKADFQKYNDLNLTKHTPGAKLDPWIPCNAARVHLVLCF